MPAVPDGGDALSPPRRSSTGLPTTARPAATVTRTAPRSGPARRPRGTGGRGEPSGRRLNPTDRREQILVCAMRLFEERSYTEVSTADIADAAGIGRPLIHHYFGTKRDLYLEVVRRFVFVPAVAVRGVAKGTLEERIDASIERWMDVASRHRKLWLTTIFSEGPGRDREMEQILQHADEIAANRMIEALGLTESSDAATLHAVMLAFGPMAKATSRLWLIEGTFGRAQVHLLLTRTLRHLILEVLPDLIDA
jgi:AcrR family transcriptional regulator